MRVALFFSRASTGASIYQLRFAAVWVPLLLSSSACQEPRDAPELQDAQTAGADAARSHQDVARAVSLEPDAQPHALDAQLSPHDAALGALPDAARTDASVQPGDAGPTLPASDAAHALVDVSAGEDAAGEAASPTAHDLISGSAQGTRCIGQTPSNLDPELCPEQACFSDNNQIMAEVVQGALRCTWGTGCPYPTPEELTAAEQDDGMVRSYEYRAADLVVVVSFRTLLLKSVTLENMRTYLRGGGVGGVISVDGRRELITAGAETADIELLSYAAGRLHLRMHATVYNYTQRIPSVSHVCPGSHTLPTICDTALCWWGTEQASGSGLPPRISADVSIPIVPYDP